LLRLIKQRSDGSKDVDRRLFEQIAASHIQHRVSSLVQGPGGAYWILTGMPRLSLSTKVLVSP
jgi:hypothetical protein